MSWGGKRGHAGRPRGGTFSRRLVRELAEAGIKEEDIRGALGISDGQLEDPETLDRFRSIVAKGNARFRVQLVRRLRRAAFVSARGVSANVLALLARNNLGYDQNQLPESLALKIELEGAAERLLERSRNFSAEKSFLSPGDK